MPVNCTSGCGKQAILKRPKTGDALCKECFFFAFEEEVHHTITSAKLFSPGEYVAIAASGGKDSTVLAHLMTLLNERYQYGLKLVLLSIDEGIAGYRDDSLETVKRNEKQYGIPLKILSYEELYGWTMDKIVQKVGRRNNCTFCGVFRRQALDRGAQQLGVDKLVTGHNADDIAETIVMNVLRGDVARLQRCCAVETGSEGHLPRSKPFKYTYEKEIVMYAYFKKLDYFSTECVYSPNAYRGHARAYIKDLEKIRPTAIIDIIHSGECLLLKEDVRLPTQMLCSRCGHVSSQAVCKACVLLEGLNKGRPRLGVGKSSKVKQKMNANPDDLVGVASELAHETNRNQGLTAANSEDLVEDTPEMNQKLSPKQDFRAGTSDEPQNIALNSHGLDNTVDVAAETKPNDDRKVALINSATSDPDKSLNANNEVSACSELVNGIVAAEADVKRQSDLDTRDHHIPLPNAADLSSSSSPRSGAGENVEVNTRCRTQLTNIEDIGNALSEAACGSGGACSGNCKNKEKKKRKVISLRNNPELALKTAGISKKDLDF